MKVRVEIGDHVFELIDCVNELREMVQPCNREKAREIAIRAGDLLADMVTAR